MVPILFESNATDFSTNGLGRLHDCVECTVTEERNGIYECEFQYPVFGRRYGLITEGRIIAVTHDDTGDLQPFILYSRTEPMNGVVTFNAHHISYRLGNVILKPMSATSILSAFRLFETDTLTEQPFTFWTNKASEGNFRIKTPRSCKEMLGGTEGSILDAFGGGEYEFDKWTVKLYQHRGQDSGVTLRYGKNITDMQREYTELGVYNAVIPFWSDQEGDTVVYGGIVSASGVTSTVVIALDLSQSFEEEPTIAQLEAKAADYLESQQPWLPNENITVSFAQLWQSNEYARYAPLQRVRLCDTVTVYNPVLNVNATLKCIKTKWNVLEEKYDSIELGKAKTSFADTIKAQFEESFKATYPNFDMMSDAIAANTAKITGGLGGHVVFKLNADLQPEEILVMDTDNVGTAVNVWRWSVGGFGHSHSGYNGPFDDIALTQDGHINASMMTVGILNANIIKAGIISDITGSNWWDLITGEISLGGSASIGGYTGDSIRQTFEAQSDLIAETQENTNEVRRYININPQIPSITIGTGEETYVEIGSEKMDFVSGGNANVSITNKDATVPTINVTTLNMEVVDASTGDTIGDLFWVARMNGHLSLKVRG